MTDRKPRDRSATVRHQLQRIAAQRNESFQAVLERFAGERFLYRLTQSSLGSRWVLKGALLFRIWTGDLHRPTRDIDLLGYGALDDLALKAAMEDVCAQDLDDGVVFRPASIRVEEIRAQQVYGGSRVRLKATLGNAEVSLQIDVGLGDTIVPAPELELLPVLLSFPAPKLLCYPKEVVIAEKLHAMVVLDMANSRMKDFYDLYMLTKQFEFRGESIVKAFQATFERRKSPIPAELPTAVTKAFYENTTKREQWQAFSRRHLAQGAPSLDTVCRQLARFLLEPLQAARDDGDLDEIWSGDKGWMQSPRQERAN